MVLSFSRIAVVVFVALAMALDAVRATAIARELAVAQGTITISEGRPGLRPPSCNELVVEARDALDDHLIAETRSSTDEAGTCRYALSVPAQTAVWMNLQPVLVAGVRAIKGVNRDIVEARGGRPPNGSVALRFTIIAPTTYFFSPGEQKVVSLIY